MSLALLVQVGGPDGFVTLAEGGPGADEAYSADLERGVPALRARAAADRLARAHGWRQSHQPAALDVLGGQLRRDPKTGKRPVCPFHPRSPAATEGEEVSPELHKIYQACGQRATHQTRAS